VDSNEPIRPLPGQAILVKLDQRHFGDSAIKVAVGEAMHVGDSGETVVWQLRLHGKGAFF